MTPQGAGEVYYVAYNESQEWFWLSNQTIDEVTVFVSYDSQRDVGPACAYASTTPCTTSNIMQLFPMERSRCPKCRMGCYPERAWKFE